MSPADHPWIPKPGDVLADKYQVEQLVGSGGMGAVVTAIQQELGRRVAIKLMPPQAAQSQRAVERFLREARAASAISNEHVVRIFDVGRLPDGVPFMVMEFLPGVTLDSVVQARGPLPIAEAVDYVLQACVALAECHALGIVHRDLKPENIMLVHRPGQLGFVKVLDFGISKSEWMHLESSFTPNLTGTTDVFGTPTHMSPEQVRSSKDVDNRADIWALGVVMYEILTGVPPFMADTLPALSAMIVSDDPPNPSLRRADIPAELSAVVLGCLAKHPDARPQSVAQLAGMLQRFAAASSLPLIERVRSIAAADPLEASRPWPRAALRPRDTTSAWGTTHSRRASTNRNVVLGVVSGVLLFAVVLAGLLYVRSRNPEAVEATAAAPSPETPAQPLPPSHTAPASAAAAGAAQTPVPAPMASNAGAPDAGASSATPKQLRVKPRRDKALDDRY
jgi:serine/threonine-protein kinase